MNELEAACIRASHARWSAVPALLLALGLLFGAGPAAAQTCGEVEAVPGAILEKLLPVLEDLEDLEVAECFKIVSAGVSACHRGVSASVQCSRAPLGGWGKVNQVVCNTLETEERGACNEAWREAARIFEATQAANANDAHTECDRAFKNTLSDACPTEP